MELKGKLKKKFQWKLKWANAWSSKVLPTFDESTLDYLNHFNFLILN